MILVSKSTPTVLFNSSLNSLRVKRNRRLDLPTPESPSNRTIRNGNEIGGEERERKGNGERDGRGGKMNITDYT